MNLSPDLTAKINKLDIDVLIRQAERFMQKMTKKPIDFEAAAKAMKRIPMLKPILADAITEGKRNGVMSLIDSLLVGDNITRGFNKAKTDKKFFEQYKQTLIEKAPTAKLKAELRKMTQGSLKISDIAFVFNGRNLRTQELALMNDRLHLNSTEQAELKNADQKLIQAM